MKNKKGFSYVIIKYNNPNFERESTLLDNDYKKKKYAVFHKTVNKDHSENLVRITYSNDLDKISKEAMKFVSFYNYPVGIYKDIKGYIREIQEVKYLKQ